MRSTQQLRELWGPPCESHHVSLLDAYRALDAVLRKWSYVVRGGVTGAYNCRRITGGSGYSLHAFARGLIFTFWTGVRVTMALAVDINWDRNSYGKKLVTDMPRGMVDEICSIRTIDGVQVWRWGGYYSGNKDAMHFEIVASPDEIARGLDPRTVPGHTPEPIIEEDEMQTLTPDQPYLTIPILPGDREVVLASDLGTGAAVRVARGYADAGGFHGDIEDGNRIVRLAPAQPVTRDLPAGAKVVGLWLVEGSHVTVRIVR